MELGEVAIANRGIDDSKIVAPLKDVIRVATEEDTKTFLENEKKSAKSKVTNKKRVNNDK